MIDQKNKKLERPDKVSETPNLSLYSNDFHRINFSS